MVPATIRKLSVLAFSILVIGLKIGNTQTCQIKYQKIDVEDGLSTGYINDVVKDDLGLLWLATEDGINRFDGQHTLVLRAGSADSIGLTFDNISALCALGEGKLLAAGQNGQLQLINTYQKTANRVELSETKGKAITKMVASNELIYLATDDKVLVLQQDNLQNLSDFELAKTGQVYMLKKDHLGIVWLSCANGLFVSRGEGKLVKIPRTEGIGIKDLTYDNNEYWAVSREAIYQIDQALNLRKLAIAGFDADNHNFKIIGLKNNFVFLGSETHGFWVLNKQQNNIMSCMDYAGAFPYYAPISCSLQDQDGNLFLGTRGDGVVHFNLGAIFSPFEQVHLPSKKYYHPKAYCNSPQGTFVCLDDKILLLDASNNVLKELPLSLENNYEIKALEAVGNKFVIGTNSGLVLLNEQGVEIDNMIHQPDNELTISSNQINALHQVNGKLYAATAAGFDEINLATGLAKRFFKGKNKPVLALTSHGQGLLLATPNGLYQFENEQITGIEAEDLPAGTLKNTTVLFAQDQVLWLGTKGQGVYTLKSKGAKQYFVQAHYLEKLTNPHITAIVSDAEKDIWVSTLLGLNRILPEKGRVYTYYENDGLVSEVFEDGLAFGTQQQLVFGTPRGLLAFNPNQVATGSKAPMVVLTSVKISGKPVYNNFEIPRLHQLEVNYFDYSFTLGFAALEYAAPQKVKYAYKLQGLSDEWLSLGNTNEVTFSNLSEGNYTLFVKAYGAHGEESANEIKLQIEIKPPFYSTLWFKILLGVVVVAIVGGIYLYRLNLEKNRSKYLEKEVEKRTAILKRQNQELEIATQRAMASDKAKSEFMATMSHEIRTPMNGILGSVGLLEQSELTDDQKDQLNVIAESGDNMLAIINEILDYSKIESGKMEPVCEVFDLEQCIQTTVESHATRANKKGLELQCFIGPEVPTQIKSDKARITQILNNLISNAVKFTREGHVFVEIALNGNMDKGKVMLRLTVADTGIGIPIDKQSEVWDAFTQVDNTSTREFGGTGLGLAIVRSMTLLLGGTVNLESSEGKGARFIIHLPVEGKAKEAEPAKWPGKRLLLASSSQLQNELLARYAKEQDMKISNINSYSSLSDSVDFDWAIVDEEMLQSQFGNNMQGVALHTALLLRKGLVVNHKTDAKYDRLLKVPVWRAQFKALFAGSEGQGTEVVVADPNTKSQEQLKILLAEDNKVNQMVTSKIFKKLGYEIDIASNGLEALEMQEKNQYGLVLMDLHMPEMDGIEATKKMRAEGVYGHPYIVAFSANIFNQDPGYFEQIGFNNAISKPAKLDELAKMLDDLKV